jgi:hypothetical protein
VLVTDDLFYNIGSWNWIQQQHMAMAKKAFR